MSMKSIPFFKFCTSFINTNWDRNFKFKIEQAWDDKALGIANTILESEIARPGAYLIRTSSVTIMT